MPAFLQAASRRLRTLKLLMITATRDATSSSIIANIATGPLTIVSTGSVLAEQRANRALLLVPKCFAGQALQPASDEKYPRRPGF